MPAYRAGQILDWVYQRGVVDPAKMSNLSKRERDLLADPEQGLTFLSGEVVKHSRASDGVEKLLVQWDEKKPPGAADRELDEKGGLALPVIGSGLDSSRQTECVMIPAVSSISGEKRRTACISSQIGCPVGCKFCASGLGGLDGNLSAGRIIEQVWRLRWHLGDAAPTAGEDPSRKAVPPRISNVVFMGMGEPLANFGSVTSAIRTLSSLWALGISARKITISTVGLPAAILKLAEQFELPVTLALSLHAPTDDIRRQLIPWAQYSTIRELLDACQKWFEKTGREITLEYTLLRGVNDAPEHARELARLAKSLRANVNLIRYNEVAGVPFNRPRTDDVRAFQAILHAQGVNTHIRASRGRDIAAACGQLRHELSQGTPR